MNITTKAQAKTVVSALRREIKALGKGPEQLSHTDCLSLTAKALGFASWNAWEASLMETAAEKPQPEVSKYPLVNNGDFDFVGSDTEGKVFSGSFVPLTMTSEAMRGTCGIGAVTRSSDDGSVDVEYDGNGTAIDYDGQTARKNAQGFAIWLDEGASEFSSAQSVIAPECCDDPEEDEELPVRPKLIQAFLDYFAEHSIDAVALNGKFGRVAKVIGFSLTMNEKAELQARVESSTNRP
jgi:hypothetical protein